jgi:hypothetical protein
VLAGLHAQADALDETASAELQVCDSADYANLFAAVTSAVPEIE